MKKLFALAFCVCALRVLAVNPVPFTEGVDFSFKINGTGSASITVYDDAGSQYVLATASGSTLESGTGTAWLRPGKVYNFDFWGLGPPDYWVSFVAPLGYTVYLDGVAADQIGDSPGTGWFLHFHTVEIRPRGTEAGGMWGNFSGVAIGKAITWSVGLGDLRTGRSAGAIQFSEFNLSNAPSSRDRLFYAAPPANVGQIVVIKDGSSNQTLRQIVTPIGFTDIVDVTGGYEFRCYAWSQVSSWTGTLYTFTGSPWKTIKVESTVANQLKITESTGTSSPIVRVSQIDWANVTSASGGTISTSGGYTIHTFNSSGTFTVNTGISSVDYLVVAGGGGGGGGSSQNGGGGGGGGGVLTGSLSVTNTAYAVTVGAGGSGGTDSSGGVGSNGGNSSFAGSVTALGGGFGGAYSGAAGAGGSGGGAGRDAACCAGTNTSGQGYAGGIGGAWSGGSAGGGGGAGGAGNNGAADGTARSGGTASDGGVGFASSISGTNTYYAGGGAGAWQITTLPAGGAGGGAYYAGSGNPGNNATPNSGGGGAGALYANGGSGGSGVVIIRYAGNPANYTCTLQESDGTTVLRTVKHTSSVTTPGERDDIVEVRTGGTGGNLVAKTTYHYVNQVNQLGLSWGEELVSVVGDPDSANPSERTTAYSYYTTSTDLGNYRRVKSITESTGNWTAYQYYNDYETRGQVEYEFHPFRDAPSTASFSTTAGRVIHFTYTADWTGRNTRPSLREETITVSGTTRTTAKTEWTHGDTTGSGEPRAYMTIKSYRGTGAFQTDYAEFYRADADPDFAGQLYMSQSPNLTQVTTSSSRGTFNTTSKGFTVSPTGDHWREVRFNGSLSSTAAGSTLVTGFNGQSASWVYMIPYKTTLDVTIRIAQGYVYRTEQWVYTGSGGTDGFHLMTAEDFEYDGEGHLTQRWASTGSGALSTYNYIKGQLRSSFDAAGTETQFTYDEIGRVRTSTKMGASGGSYATQHDIITTYTYDGANRVRQTETSDYTNSEKLTSKTNYDLAGRLTDTTTPRTNTTDYTTGYGYELGGRKVTVTFPGGATEVTERHRDGRVISVTGTSVTGARAFAYDINSSGNLVTEETLGSSVVATTTNDWLSRAIAAVKPSGTGSGTTTATNSYNDAGQLYKTSQPGLADTLYTYDTLGRLFREGLDLSDSVGTGGADGALNEGGKDRLTEHTWTYASTGFAGDSGWFAQQSTIIYPESTNRAQTIARSEQKLAGLPAGRLSRVDSYDAFGNRSYTAVDVNRSSKLLTTTTTYSDASTSAVQVTYNGLQVAATDKAGVTTNFGYDDLGRTSTSTNMRTSGITTTFYVSGTTQIEKIKDATAGTAVYPATYTYNAAGRVESVKDALGKFAYYEYYPTGLKKREWGDTVNPVEYAYDAWGHCKLMTTYRGGGSWSSSTWNSSPGTPDYTLWDYDEPTGLLKNKYDAANIHVVSSAVVPISGAKKVAYTYNAAGQVKTRTWARGSATTYYYFGEGSGEPATGELRKVDYADTSMTDLEYTYNRLGRIATVKDATCASGESRVFNYDLGSGGTLQLTSEDLPATFFNSRRITYGHDTATGVVGRPNALQLGTAGSPTANQAVAYGYESATGRFNSVAAGGQTFTYTYTTNSNLIEKVANTALNFDDIRTYEAKHDWVADRESKWGSSHVSMAKFHYTQDNAGRISKIEKTSNSTNGLFNRYGNSTQGLTTNYAYNDRSEVIGEKTQLGGTTTDLYGRNDGDSTTPGYAYDNMGNRTTVTHNGTTLNYTPNSLNQYTSIDFPRTFDVAGRTPGNTVTVKLNPGGASPATASRNGEYFFQEYGLATALGSGSGAGSSLLDIVDNSTPTPFSATMPAFVSATPLVLSSSGYDDDGNMLKDDRWVYTYDAENRLLTAENSGAQAGGVTRQKLTFVYDYLGRRASKLVQTGSTLSTTNQSLRFIYDGWNLVAELDALSSSAVIRSYCWGLDLSGSHQGAGGVGGVLMAQGAFYNAETGLTDTGKTLVAVYDGNGNLHGMLNTGSVSGANSSTYSAGNFVAAYEYDAFGKTLRETGPYASAMPFRFSTKYTDNETALVYYGLRYYSPSLGRFINKDPIEEKGGLNLYAICGNNLASQFDMLGLWPTWSLLPVHQRSIDRVFGTAATDPMRIAQTIADSFQGKNYSFIHAMTGGQNGNKTLFRVQADMFISGAFALADAARVDGNSEMRDFYVGLGLHTLQDTTSTPHENFAVWLGLLNPIAAISHVFGEMHDPGANSGLDANTAYGKFLAENPQSRPADYFDQIEKKNGGTFDYAAAQATLSDKDKALVAKALQDAADRYNQYKEDVKSGEALRKVRFNVISDLGDQYIGSDEWMDAHSSVAQWKISVLNQGALYNAVMSVSAPEAKDRVAYMKLAEYYHGQSKMAQLMQEAVDAGNTIKNANPL